jgi:hypothetical protein
MLRSAGGNAEDGQQMRSVGPVTRLQVYRSVIQQMKISNVICTFGMHLLFQFLRLITIIFRAFWYEMYTDMANILAHTYSAKPVALS